MALSEEQAEQACDAYGTMMASLKRVTAEQSATSAGWPQQPGAAYITTRARTPQRDGRQHGRALFVLAE